MRFFCALIFLDSKYIYCDTVHFNLPAPRGRGYGRGVRTSPEKGGGVGDAAFTFKARIVEAGKINRFCFNHQIKSQSNLKLRTLMCLKNDCF